MTNVMPTPRTAQTAMFCEISEKLLVEKNLSPAVTLKNATITKRTPRIHTDCTLVIRLISDCWASSATSTAASSGGVITLMRVPPC